MSKSKLGTVYQRGESWVIDYYINGGRIRETVKGAKNESQARAKLKERISQIHTGIFIRHEEKIGFEDLVKLIEDEYRLKQRRGITTMKVHVRHLREFFRHYPAIKIQPAIAVDYQEHRLEQKASPATINRETACLHHMLQIAYDMGKLSRVPKFTKLEGERVREGFLGWAEFDRVLAEINGQWRKNFIEFLFLVGWRSGKAKSLEWNQIFLTDTPWLKTDPGSVTKKSGSDLPLSGRLLEIIKAQAELRRLDCPYVFHNNGRKVGDLRKSWHNATKKAELEGKVIHDFRRSTARNLTSLGVPQQVIMARCGWRTASTFHRHAIVDHSDQEAANNAIDQARAGATTNLESIKKGEAIVLGYDARRINWVVTGL
jgi:integrase